MMDRNGSCMNLAKRGTVAMALVLLATGSAVAQDNWDGNIVFGNFSGGYDPSAPCDATLYRDHGALNDEVDPMLTDPFNQDAPNWVPMAGSPAIGTIDDVSRIAIALDACDGSNDENCTEACESGIVEVCWRGGVPPAQFGEDWTQGWTYYSKDGTGRGDLDFNKPTIIIEGEVGINDGLNDPNDTTMSWSADNNYLLRGRCSVEAGQVLTIPPGVAIFGENASDGFLVIERDGQINAVGTAEAPIIMTTDLPPGQMTRGGWGGLLINGNAVANCADCRNGESCESEGGNGGFFCGADDCDSSGTLRYVRVEYAGITVGENNELNAFTFNGVGCGTDASFLQAHMGDDDNFEWFGGKMHSHHLVATGGADDDIDWQMGFRGTVQFAVSQKYADAGDKSIEADNNEFGFDNPCRSNPTIANCTFIGPNDDLAAGSDGINLRRGTDAQVFNTIIQAFVAWGLDVDDGATTCARGFNAAPGIYCGPEVAVEPGTGSTPQVAFRAFPNPVTSRASFAFDVASSGLVDLSIFDINGRLVDTVVNDQLTAGTHQFDWNVPASTPSGVYYYRFLAGDQEATGRFMRVR